MKTQTKAPKEVRDTVADALVTALSNLQNDKSFKLGTKGYVVRRAKSGFYTNRLGYGEMLAAFKAADYDVVLNQVDRWQTPPLSRGKMAPEFSHRTDDDLTVSGFNVVLRPLPE